MGKKKSDKIVGASHDEAFTSAANTDSPATSKYQTRTKTTAQWKDSWQTPERAGSSHATASGQGRVNFSTPPAGGNSERRRSSSCAQTDAPSAGEDSGGNVRVSQDSKGSGRSKFKAKVKGLFSKKSSKTLYADARHATTTIDIPHRPAHDFSSSAYQDDWKLSPQQGRTSCYYRPGLDALLAEGQAQNQLYGDAGQYKAATHIRLPPSMIRARRPMDLNLGPRRRGNWNVLRTSRRGEWLFIEKPTLGNGDPKLPLLYPEDCHVPTRPRYKFERPPHTARALRSMLTYKYNHNRDKAEPVWKIDNESQLGMVRKVAMRKLQMIGFNLNRHFVKIDFGYDDPWGRMFHILVTHVDTHARYEWILYCCLPKFPKYKLRSVVATMMYLREHTDLPVPRVVAHEYDTNNPLGMEFMMVERLPGFQYNTVEKRLSFEAKKTFARGIADLVDGLSRLRFSDIGNIHRDFEAPNDAGSYFVDICTEPHLIKDMRIDYPVPRGPFKSLYEYYSAHIAVVKNEAQDHRQEERLAWWFPSQVDPKRKTKDERTVNEMVKERLKSFDADEDGPWDFMPPPTYSHDDLQLLPTYCNAFQNILHFLVKNQEFPLGATRLAHFNLSKENILVNGAGQVTGILDWDYTWVAPPELIPKYPRCLPDLNEEAAEPMLSFAADDGDAAREDKWEEMLLAMEYEDRLRELGSPHLDVLHHDRNPLLAKMEKFLRRVPSMETFMNFLDEVESSRKAEGAAEEESL
ncbi:uncharacterized protein IWZ02DRAFT_500107 [Phyllosticta citriasiana]|uniref:uncharacterized protein n=1 Tax=Phyllosticta citriasiana TaxID=595635 RepID=UPI0030FD78F2